MARRTSLALLAIVAATVGAIVAPAGGARAMTTLNWFVQVPGFVATDVVATQLGYSAGDNSLYAVTESVGELHLVKIDVELFEIVDEAPISIPTGEVVDVQASDDGSFVYVLGLDTVVRIDGADLTQQVLISLPDPADWNMDIAPTDPDRFVVWDQTATNVAFYDGTTGTPVTAIGDGPDAGVVFLDDATIAGIADGTFVEVDLATDLATRTEPFARNVQDHLEVVGDELWVDGYVVGITDLAPRHDHPGVVQVRRDGAFAFVGEASLERTIVDTADGTIVGSFQLPDRDAAAVALFEPMGGTEAAVLEFTATDRLFLSMFSGGVLASAIGEFHSVGPERVLDTRFGVGTGGATSPLGPDGRITVQITGNAGIPADGVSAVVMNATVTEPTAASYFSIWPTGLDQPTVSNLNFAAGQTLPNLVTVPLGDGSVELFNKFGTAHAILDVMGYYSSSTGEHGARYVPLRRPERVVDTRAGLGATSLGPGQTFTVDFSGATPFGTTGSVVAVAVNTTAVNPTAPSFLTVHSSDSSLPVASNLNVLPGEVRANMVIASVDAATVSADVYNLAGSVDVVMDVVGMYVVGDGPGVDQAGRYMTVPPFRRFDSREDFVFPAPGQLPADAGVIFGSGDGWTDIVNVTAVTPTAPGFLSVVPHSDDGGFPAIETSNVNFTPGAIVANSAYATGGPDFLVYNSHGDTHVVVDVFGYITPEKLSLPEDAWE